MNRRGGCASRRSNPRMKNTDFEDFGLAETDFPHHRSPAMAAAALGGVAMGGAAATTSSSTSPTIPRVNESNMPGANPAYYGTGGMVPPPSDYDSGRHYAPYQPQIDEYAMQQQQGYYYPQDQGQGYYDNQYYYENQPPLATAGNDYGQPHHLQQQQQPGGHEYIQPQPHYQQPQQHFSPIDNYKPDQMDKPNEWGWW